VTSMSPRTKKSRASLASTAVTREPGLS